MPPKGYKQSESCKEKLRIFRTGKKTPREVLDKINATKIKNRSAFYKRSEQEKIRIGSLRKGLTPWNKGIKRFDIRGKKHPLWNGGSTPLLRTIRTSFEYREWRRKIFVRDDYTCVLCHNRGNQDINADHHPIWFSDIISENNIKTIDDALKCELLWNTNNGRTLCVRCHRKTFKRISK